jgi:hypothetical protein
LSIINQNIFLLWSIQYLPKEYQLARQALALEERVLIMNNFSVKSIWCCGSGVGGGVVPLT